ncbi:hypothetical protein HMPREF1545_00282 [Oscillibacter sp. KLE 1728]|nr:hypothetical protein HMPREF1545_00282 [Oscillibacter sp. KLE 1728]ERK65207.1 hypothetical protein HMPREF1546_01394 [Oscillibacter sp. KLE 1745]
MEGQKSLPHTTSVRALLRPLGCIRLSPGLLERIFRMTTFFGSAHFEFLLSFF